MILLEELERCWLAASDDPDDPDAPINGGDLVQEVGELLRAYGSKIVGD